MPTRTVVLTAHHESVIEALVSSGRYQNASEVLREGLRLLEQREAMEAARLKVAATVGFDDLDAERFCDVRGDELPDLIAALGRQAAAKAGA
ncbi:MAG: type II toxin-antitoxin system ParD family antitoxin [Rhodopila sp.]|jgi:antitoxin ParD1/3/4